MPLNHRETETTVAPTLLNKSTATSGKNLVVKSRRHKNLNPTLQVENKFKTELKHVIIAGRFCTSVSSNIFPAHSLLYSLLQSLILISIAVISQPFLYVGLHGVGSIPHTCISDWSNTGLWNVKFGVGTYMLVWHTPWCCGKFGENAYCTPTGTWLVLLKRKTVF